ncbi:MAG: V-type ATP synthase subunit I [Tannerella sp.]|jgi:V/A-type H+-transporting ATPase subunit I|nr:V-type ATP synthase subunit I [Tannerella sp.]
MIAKMSKYAFMVYHREYEPFLKRLREIGAVHVQEREPVGDVEESRQLQAERKRLRTQMLFLEKRRNEARAEDGKNRRMPASAHRITKEEGAALLNEIEQTGEQLIKQQAVRQSLEKDIALLSIWGEFEYAGIERLRQAGYEVAFFTCPASGFDTAWEDRYHAIRITQVQSTVYFLTITPENTPPAIGAERVRLPEHGPGELRRRLAAEQEYTDELNRKLTEIAFNDFHSLKSYDNLLLNEAAAENVRLYTGREAEDKLRLLEGWIPAAQAGAMEQALEAEGYFFRKLETAPGDDVPILFRNNAFSRLFEPISRLYMLPKYSELDMTPFLAPFFMLFFGLCLGDSGYGLLLLLGATGAKLFMAQKLPASVKPVLSLVQLLGISTFFCGLLTGAFFGTNVYDWGIPALEQLKEKVAMDNSKMFMMALLLGAVQILFGMCLNVANRMIQFGFVHGLSTIGWIILLAGTGVAWLFPGVMPLFGTLHLSVAGIAAVLIFFLNSPGKNIFLNIGLGIWDAYNMATGLLGDVLSYVRLFALGLSGGILASVFNSLATGMRPDNVILGPVVMALILLIGHALNIFMNVLGAVVHPMRLTFVEFFKNAGYTGGGKAYKPFQWKNY